MIVLMVRIEVAVRMRVPRTIRMLVFVLVKYDFEATAEGIGYAA
jgi:hypothetical protein